MNNTIKRKNHIMKDYGIIIIFFLVVIILAISTPTFRKPLNLLNVIKQASVNGVLSMGMMILIITGGIDLSGGSVVALSGVCAAIFGHPGEYPLIIPILVACLSGTLIGLVNGIGVAYGEIPPFIITLGTMSIAKGLALVISDGIPIIDMSESFNYIAGGSIFGLPILPFYFIIIAAIFGFVMNKTVYGRRLYSIGGNRVAAEVSGINVKRHLALAYTIAGCCSGIAGLLMASRTSQGSPVVGQGYEMDAVTACVIGGVSMTGGVGKVFNVVIGALFIAIIENALTIFSVDANWKQVVKGLIIIGAVLLDVKTKGKKK
jgi:ribose/xylose/arabinose/galactoside ABC-type transport system permease subunit